MSKFEGAQFTTDDANSPVILADGRTSFLQGSPLWNEMVAEGITPADYVDPRTLQQIYDEEVLASLDRQVLKDAARMVEDFYDALVDQLPQSMKDKHGPLMAERKTKRAARP
jgi:hypothetical protein